MAKKNTSAVLVGKWVGVTMEEGQENCEPHRREIKLQGCPVG